MIVIFIRNSSGWKLAEEAPQSKSLVCPLLHFNGQRDPERMGTVRRRERREALSKSAGAGEQVDDRDQTTIRHPSPSRSTSESFGKVASRFRPRTPRL